MSWVSPLQHTGALYPGEDRVRALWITPPMPGAAPIQRHSDTQDRNRGGMGSAAAARPIAWHTPAPAPVHTPTSGLASAAAAQPARMVGRLSVSPELWQAVAARAAETGRSEDEAWAEAAREWLARRAQSDEPPPSAPASAALSSARNRRVWHAIDTTLAELRQTPPSSPAA